MLQLYFLFHTFNKHLNLYLKLVKMNHHQESNRKWLGGQCPYVNCQIITFITIIRNALIFPVICLSWLPALGHIMTLYYRLYKDSNIFFHLKKLSFLWFHFSRFIPYLCVTSLTFLSNKNYHRIHFSASPFETMRGESPLACKGNTWQGVMSVATQRGSEPRAGPAGLAQSPHAPFTVPVTVSSSLNPSVSFLFRTVRMTIMVSSKHRTWTRKAVWSR